MNPLKALNDYGQSVWLDHIHRRLLVSGELRRLMDTDGINGITSNPTIFRQAIAEGGDYRDDIAAWHSARNPDPQVLYEALVLEDTRRAADLLRPVYDATEWRDGYVSLEVSPCLADDPQATCAAARRLWRSLDRDNVMIKVPATPAGLPAIETLLAEGINVNVTLLFSPGVYERVVEAHMRGLERLAQRGGDLRRVTGIASFFVSRIDTAVDALIDARLAGNSGSDRTWLEGIRGRVAIASAKSAYRHFKRSFSGERWRNLAAQGAQVQRLLWASTGVKNPRYRDVRYVEELIGPDTVNTMPPATLAAFRHHGRLRSSLADGRDDSEDVLARLAQSGIALETVADRLLADGMRLFENAYSGLPAVAGTARQAG